MDISEYRYLVLEHRRLFGALQAFEGPTANGSGDCAATSFDIRGQTPSERAASPHRGSGDLNSLHSTNSKVSNVIGTDSSKAPLAKLNTILEADGKSAQESDDAVDDTAHFEVSASLSPSWMSYHWRLTLWSNNNSPNNYGKSHISSKRISCPLDLPLSQALYPGETSGDSDTTRYYFELLSTTDDKIALRNIQLRAQLIHR